MKLITFSHQSQNRVGAVVNDKVFDSFNIAELPKTMLEFLQQGQTALDKMQNYIDTHAGDFQLNEVKLLAPVPNPRKLLGVGLNYADHINETDFEKPEYPTIFNKQTSCITGQEDSIQIPRVSEKVDYEGELAFVIGKNCRHVPEDKAHQVIAGFMIANDVTVRDWQIRTPTWTLGKSFDTHGPLGPFLVTTDEIKDPHNLRLKTWVDDELRQNANTKQMIFNCYQLIAYLTTVMTLEVGDIISTGTPSGVGVKMKPRGYLKAGQTVKVEIEGLGMLSNPVINEPNNNSLY